MVVVKSMYPVQRKGQQFLVLGIAKFNIIETLTSSKGSVSVLQIHSPDTERSVDTHKYLLSE
jgi:hypothetical protein